MPRRPPAPPRLALPRVCAGVGCLGLGSARLVLRFGVLGCLRAYVLAGAIVRIWFAAPFLPSGARSFFIAQNVLLFPDYRLDEVGPPASGPSSRQDRLLGPSPGSPGDSAFALEKSGFPSDSSPFP